MTIPQITFSKKVMLATPTCRGLGAAYTASLLNTLGSQRVLDDSVMITPFIWPGESLITRARNDIVRHFLAGDFTHLFFVDDDISWEPDAFFDVVKMCTGGLPYDQGVHVVGGVYPIKTLRWDRLVGVTIESEEQAKRLTLELVINGADRNHSASSEDLVVTQDLGTGFMCITRESVEAMAKQYAPESYLSNARQEARQETPNLFDTMLDGDTLLSEDYAFCRRWQKMGGLCFTATQIPLLTHVGPYSYGRF